MKYIIYKTYIKTVKKSIAMWLFISAFMVLLMIVLGGYTRLENAGLSIVEWKPVTGVILPFDTKEWQLEFQNYQTSPEYKEKNFDISISEFKKIYFIEYFHRLIGRLAGLVFLVPFIYFAFKKELSVSDIKYLTFVFALGAMQGFLGWYMVKSGLSNRPEVSHYRLTSHLLIAISIYGLLIWKALSFLKYRSKSKSYNIIKYFYILTGLTILQIALGGFIAGLDGGLIYNSFPLMDDQIIPRGLFIMKPWYLNFFNNITMLQFLHRLVAMIIAIYIMYLYIYAKAIKLNICTCMKVLVFVIAIQITLGVLTLTHMVPTNLALLHQLFAIILFTNLLLILYKLIYFNKNHIQKEAYV